MITTSHHFGVAFAILDQLHATVAADIEECGSGAVVSPHDQQRRPVERRSLEVARSRQFAAQRGHEGCLPEQHAPLSAGMFLVDVHVPRHLVGRWREVTGTRLKKLEQMLGNRDLEFAVHAIPPSISLSISCSGAPASVDRDHGSGDESALGEQVGNHRGDLRRVAEPFEDVACDVRVLELFGPGGGQRLPDRSRRDRVDKDPVGALLGCRLSGQGLEAALGRGVHREARYPSAAGHRTGVDDAAAASGLHVRDHRPHPQPAAFEVDRDQTVPPVLAE